MNKHNKHYRQLTQEPRYQISALRKTGMKVRAIALEVGVHFSTVSRELCRNASGDGYDPVIAHQLSENRKITADKANKRHERTDAIIKEFLTFRWSPETISQRLKIEAKEHEQPSHSTIYRRIEVDRQQRSTVPYASKVWKNTLERRKTQQESRGQNDSKQSRYRRTAQGG